MRKLLLITASILMAACAVAAPQYIPFEVSYGTNDTDVLTNTVPVIGYIDEVYVQAPTEASVTAIVSIVSNPIVGSALTPTVIFTNSALTAADIARPRVTQTDNTGSDLSTLTVAERFFCLGDSVSLIVDQSSAVTGVTFKAWIKTVQ